MTRRLTPYLFLAPALALIAIFLVYPIVSVFYYSFLDYDIVTTPTEITGAAAAMPETSSMARVVANRFIVSVPYSGGPSSGHPGSKERALVLAVPYFQ